MKSKILAGVALLAGLSSGAAQASQATANLNISATVADTCGVTDSTLSFGTVVPTAGTTLPVVGSISVTCTLGTSFNVGLGNGLNVSGGARRMRRGSSTDYLNYEIYKDALGVTRFGDTGASDRASGLGVGLIATPVAFYGQVPSSQTAATGSYADTVQITLYY